MDAQYVSLAGTVVAPEGLTVPQAADLASRLGAGQIEYGSLVECREREDAEVVVFDVAVELGQVRKHPIERSERIAVEFDRTDVHMPEVLALRATFPAVPHLNLRIREIPRSLCLYTQAYQDLKRTWTASRFVEDIRSWLARTAKGTLHEADQSLEPLLLEFEGHLILPAALADCGASELFEYMVLDAFLEERGKSVFVALPQKAVDQEKQRPAFVASMHECAPVQHGIIRRAPADLEDLCHLVETTGMDLLEELRERIERWKDAADKEPDKGTSFLQSRLALIIVFPKTRTAGGVVETSDIWAFLVLKPIQDVGVAIGLWSLAEGVLGRELSPPPDRTGKGVTVGVLNPVFRVRRDGLARLSGLAGGSALPFVAVGAGALGSQVVMNLARAGFGACTVIDDDVVLPHNLARHVADGSAIGYPKAAVVTEIAASLVEDPEGFAWIKSDVLHPGEDAGKVADALKDAAVVLDLSASVTVARALARDERTMARRISLFLNPAGRDLVLLAEDAERTVPLDALEMQYYRALVRKPRLAGHFSGGHERPRYGQACRDLTSRVPQEAFGVHAAIGSRAVRQVLDAKHARIAIWRSKEDLSVTRIEVRPSGVGICTVGDWTLYLDEWVSREVGMLRRRKLPKETGGVLIGSFDLERKVVYVVDALPSPPDSEEWPTLYIRGCRGLKRRVDEIARLTDGALQYVGEWHSHPDHCSTAPSREDFDVFAWLTEIVGMEGLPGVMVIAGQHGVSCFIGALQTEECLVPRIQP
ncbi:MAG: ThiF family adenylyltransferase [Thermoguttaceae bacterium]|jgi:integrative and conjugative element protein (TIGR02256 family)|nr:ThiF family adenylyltransferase [Thermoguttaceae bacterium]